MFDNQSATAVVEPLAALTKRVLEDDDDNALLAMARSLSQRVPRLNI